MPGDFVILQASHNIKKAEGKARETDEEILRREIPFSKNLPSKFFI